MERNRIIRVSGCHQCYKKRFVKEYYYWTCKIIGINIVKFMQLRSLPDNCPLDSLNDLISPLKGVLHKMGEAPTNQELIEAINETINKAEKQT